MLPFGWLGDLLRQFDWGHSDTSWNVGEFFNIYLKDVAFLGFDESKGLQYFTGQLAYPSDQMSCCCLHADGKTHDCVKQRLEHQPMKICFSVSTHAFNPDMFDEVNSAIIIRAKYVGLRMSCFSMSNLEGMDNPLVGPIPIDYHAMTGFPHEKLHERNLGDNQTREGTATADDASATGSVDEQEVVLHFEVMPGESKFLPQKVESTDVSRASDLQSESVALVELFSGAFAGWKQATTIMEALGISWSSTHAVEMDLHVAQLYIRNFGIPCFIDESDPSLQQPGPIVGCFSDESTMFRGDVQNLDWLKTIPWGKTIVAVMSPPCPPWSKASPKDGLFHHDGRLFIHALIALRVLKPAFIGFENVERITGHPHFKAILDVLQWCGYRLIDSACLELKKIAPVNRNRWIAVAVPISFPIGSCHALFFPELPAKTLDDYQVFIPLPMRHEQELTLNEELKEFYGNPCLFRGGDDGIRTGLPLSSEQVLNARLRTGIMKLSTIMATYGNQHSIPFSRLQEVGLFTELFGGKYGIRFFSPIECAILHGLATAMVFPLGSRLGHLVVGNAISMPHACIALATIRSLMHPNRRIDPALILIQAMTFRLHAGNARVVIHGDDMWIVRNEVYLMRSLSHEFDEQMDEDLEPTMIDTTISDTMPFESMYLITCTALDGIQHAFTVDRYVNLRDALRDNFLFCEGTAVFGEDDRYIPWSHEIDSDLTLVLHRLAPQAVEFLTKHGTWFIVENGCSPKGVMDGFFTSIERGDVYYFDHALNELKADAAVSNDTLVFALKSKPAFQCVCNEYLPVSLHLGQLCLVLPELRVASDRITVVAFDVSYQHEVRNLFNKVLATFHDLFVAAKWSWVESDIEGENGILGRLFPLDASAAPVHALVLPLLRLFSCHVFDKLVDHHGHFVQLKFNGLFMWDGYLPGKFQIEFLHDIFGVLLSNLGLKRVAWVLRGKRCDFQVSLDQLLRGDSSTNTLKFHLVSELVGGGGSKIDAWRECKSLLGRELIAKGWPLNGLDATTSEWLQKIGVNRIFNILKQQSGDKRWNNLIDVAKWHGLTVVPEDPIRLRAARTIQQAIRQKAPMQIRVADFTPCADFFLDEAKNALGLLDRVDLKASGVCFMEMAAAAQWLVKPAPLVKEELAILTLFTDDLPSGVPSPTVLTFPATDVKGRRVILRGCMWQLGEKHVVQASKEQKIETVDTIVVAVTVWRDECTDQEWQEYSSSLVKSSFAKLDSFDASANVLQVWGRCYRDQFSKVEPCHAASAQFHCRVMASCVDSLLKLSGQGPIYLTPKTEGHLAHPDWAILWLSDKVEADIAMKRATSHAGIVRAKTKYALRVKAAVLQQVAKEVMPTKPIRDAFPIKHLFKVEPLPIGLLPERIVQWAKGFKWNVRVIRKLGKRAALIGSDMQPPFAHLSMNGELILIKQIEGHKPGVNNAQFVAGPRPPTANKSSNKGSGKGSEGMRDPVFEEDAWSAYRSTTGSIGGSSASTGKSANASLAPPPGLSRQLEAPTAAKFTALEERMTQFEKGLEQQQKQQHNLHVGFEKLEKKVDQNMHSVDSKIQNLQSTLALTVDNTIQKALHSQDQKLDARFAELIGMLQPGAGSGTGRKRSEATHSDMEDSPEKPPCKK